MRPTVQHSRDVGTAPRIATRCGVAAELHALAPGHQFECFPRCRLNPDIPSSRAAAVLVCAAAQHLAIPTAESPMGTPITTQSVFPTADSLTADEGRHA